MKNICHLLLLPASLIVLMLCADSCFITPDDDNDNSKLVGTKWYNPDGSLGLEYSDNDWVFFYLDGELIGSGTYTYNASKGTIVFDSFTVIGEPGQEIFL